MSEISLPFSYDCLTLRHQYDGTLCGFNLDFSQGYFPKRWWLFHPRDLISMHICTTEPQNLITLFPVQPQMVCHLKQVTNTVSQFFSKVESSITGTTWEVSSPTSCSKGRWTLKPDQVAQGSCSLRFWKPPRTDALKLLWATQIERYFAYTSSPFSIYGHCLKFQSPLQVLGGCWEVPPQSSHLQTEQAPLPWPLLTGHVLQPLTIMVAPAGFTPVCLCLFLDQKALSLQWCQWLVPSQLSTRSPGSSSSRAASQPDLIAGWVCSSYRTLHLLFLKLLRFCSAHYCSLLGSLWMAALSSKIHTLLIHVLVN